MLNSNLSRVTPAPITLEDCRGLYTANYCEENVWRLLHLANQRGCPAHSLFAIFITNSSRRVAILNQRAAKGFCCVWDYHVIAMTYAPENHGPPGASGGGGGGVNDNQSNSKYKFNGNGQIPLVYDVDSTLQPFPTTLANYVHCSFDESITAQYLFRVVTFDDLMNNFASDRRHMKTRDDATHHCSPHSEFISPPPRFSCIQARQLTHKHTLPYFLHVPGVPGEEDFLSRIEDNESSISIVNVGTVLYGVKQLLEYF